MSWRQRCRLYFAKAFLKAKLQKLKRKRLWPQQELIFSIIQCPRQIGCLYHDHKTLWIIKDAKGAQKVVYQEKVSLYCTSFGDIVTTRRAIDNVNLEIFRLGVEAAMTFSIEIDQHLIISAVEATKNYLFLLLFDDNSSTSKIIYQKIYESNDQQSLSFKGHFTQMFVCGSNYLFLYSENLHLGHVM